MNLIKNIPFFTGIVSTTMTLAFASYLLTKKYNRTNVKHVVLLYLISALYSFSQLCINTTTNMNTLYIAFKLKYFLITFYAYLLFIFFNKINNFKFNKVKNSLKYYLIFSFITIFFSNLILKKEKISIVLKKIGITYNTLKPGPLYTLFLFLLFAIVIFIISRIIYLKKYKSFVNKLTLLSCILLIIAGLNDIFLRLKIYENIFIFKFALLLIPILFSTLIIKEIIQNETKIISLNQSLLSEKNQLELNVKRRIKRLEDTKKEIKNLNEITKQINKTLDFKSVFTEIFKHLSEMYDFEGCYLALITPDKKFFKIEEHYFPIEEKEFAHNFNKIKIPLSNNLVKTSQCITNNKIYYYENIDPEAIINDINKITIKQLQIKSIIHIPVVVNNEVIGSFALSSHSKNISLSENDISSIERFVNQIAVMLKNSLLYKQITEKSDKLEHTLSTVEEANKLKAKFVTMISHELRTPMTGILGFSELLTDTKTLNKRQKDFANRILNLGNKLLLILNDLLEFSSIEADQITINFETFDIEQLIEEIYSIFKNDLDKKNIIFEKNINDVKEIYSDHHRIRQVLINLIGNAIKFTKNGKICVNLCKNNKNFLFSVEDTGIGINEKDQNIIFEMFRQVEPSSKRKYQGTGLGLAICEKIIQKLNGKIWVKSQVDKGSIFYFTIPAKNSEKPETKAPDNDNIKVANQEKQCKLLFAEDDENTYYFIKETLSLYTNHIFKGFTNGADLINEFKGNPDYDIILLDIQMDTLNGIDTLKEIRKIDSTIPTIALTAFAMEEERKKFLDIGFTDFIAKPIDIDAFINRINSLIDNSSNSTDKKQENTTTPEDYYSKNV